MGKKEKTEVGKGVEKESRTNMAIFVRDAFEVLPQLAPDMRTLRLLKLIYNTERSSDKQQCNIRP